MADKSENGSVYELSGPAKAPVVVLIHGLGLNRHVWQWHEPALASRYRVLNYDLFGHGESAPPPVKPSLTMFADQLLGLLDFLGRWAMRNMSAACLIALSEPAGRFCER